MHGAVGEVRTGTLNVQLVSGQLFLLFGHRAKTGRSFTEAEDEPAGGHPVAMISYSWWDRRFAHDPAIIGKTVTLGSTVYTFIGITPPGFFGTTVGESPDVWIPLSMEKQVSPGWNGLDDKSFQSLYILGRLKTGVSASAGSGEHQPAGRGNSGRGMRVTLTKQQQDRPPARSDRADPD